MKSTFRVGKLTCFASFGCLSTRQLMRFKTMSVKCYRHGGNAFNLRAKLEDLIEIEKRRSGSKLSKTDLPMNFAHASRLIHSAISVMRIIGWAWRWAEWFVDFNSTWEPLLEEYQREEDMTQEELKIVESTRETRCHDARKCRLAAFGAAVRNRDYDNDEGLEEDYDRQSFDRAIRALLHTPSLVGPLERHEIEFFVEWLSLAYWSKSRLLGFGNDKIEVNPQSLMCIHSRDKSPKFVLGSRPIPGRVIQEGGASSASTDEVDELMTSDVPCGSPRSTIKRKNSARSDSDGLPGEKNDDRSPKKAKKGEGKDRDTENVTSLGISKKQEGLQTAGFASQVNSVRLDPNINENSQVKKPVKKKQLEDGSSFDEGASESSQGTRMFCPKEQRADCQGEPCTASQTIDPEGPPTRNLEETDNEPSVSPIKPSPRKRGRPPLARTHEEVQEKLLLHQPTAVPTPVENICLNNIASVAGVQNHRDSTDRELKLPESQQAKWHKFREPAFQNHNDDSGAQGSPRHARVKETESGLTPAVLAERAELAPTESAREGADSLAGNSSHKAEEAFQCDITPGELQVFSSISSRVMTVASSMPVGDDQRSHQSHAEGERKEENGESDNASPSSYLRTRRSRTQAKPNEGGNASQPVAKLKRGRGRPRKSENSIEIPSIAEEDTLSIAQLAARRRAMLKRSQKGPATGSDSSP